MEIKMKDWPADKIKRKKVDALIPYARNARTHSDEQVAQLAASIKEWGWTTPVLVDEDGEIIAGHGRVMAARKLGIEEVPTMTASGWTKAQKQAYVLADNQLPQNAGWDMDLLKIEMQGLEDEGFDLELIGFGEGEITNILLPTEVGETDATEEWEGMPDFEQDDKKSFRHVVVHFENNDDVKEFFSIIGQSHTDKTNSIWFPEQITMDTEAKRYG
jgi:ParB-like chromosome segregation protein Spo0J|tara:strand:+ start:12237 stop:12884 length:648 start_codon:yes stop_codon:yes gene_type:complete